MAKSTVAVRFTGDTTSLKRAVNDVDGSMSKIGGSVAKHGKAIAVGIGGAVGGLAVLGKGAVDAGSDLNESLSKSNTVFGESALAVETFADNAAKNLGQSKQEALDAASGFGNMFTQLGIGEAQAAGMSQQMVILASDFASFHNADISDVVDAQSAAFRGEYDSLQKFVPTINAAAVEQEALRQTGKKTTAELTAQEKALAVQSLMMSGAGDAAGDFARTSDGLANKQRIMGAQFKDVQAKIGQALIPVVLKLADVFMNKVVPAVQDMAAVVQDHWPQIQETITRVVQAISDFVTPIIGALQALWDNFGNNILELVQRVWPRIQQVIEGVLGIIRGIIQTVTSLIRGDWAGVWEGIKGIVTSAWEFIQGSVGTALEALRAIVGVITEIIVSGIKAAWDGIIDYFKDLPGKLADAGAGMFDWIKEAFRSVINWVIRKWNDFELKVNIPDAIPGLPDEFKVSTPNIPTLHTGGVYRAPGGAREGLALLETGETVTPVGGGRGDVYNINVTAQHEPVALAVVRELKRDKLLQGTA